MCCRKSRKRRLPIGKHPDIFKKEAIADLKIESKKIHIEVQSGFTGVNDIKKSKADDAKRRYSENGWKTVIVHFDLFRGLVAAVDITKRIIIW